eukprot:4778431-Pleurochrysis_carterae.AAC.2
MRSGLKLQTPTYLEGYDEGLVSTSIASRGTCGMPPVACAATPMGARICSPGRAAAWLLNEYTPRSMSIMCWRMRASSGSRCSIRTACGAGACAADTCGAGACCGASCCGCPSGWCGCCRCGCCRCGCSCCSDAYAAPHVQAAHPPPHAPPAAFGAFPGTRGAAAAAAAFLAAAIFGTGARWYILSMVARAAFRVASSEAGVLALSIATVGTPSLNVGA